MSNVRSNWFSVLSPTDLGVWPMRSYGGRSGVCIAALLAASLGGGCSTDVSRFDLPVFGASEGAAPPPLPPPRGRSGVGGPATAIAPVSTGTSDNVVRPIPRGGNAGASSGVSVANLPDTTVAQSKIPVDVPPVKRAAPRPALQPAAAPTAGAATASAPTTGGQTIDVAPGDTLYRISAQHRVSIADLMAANNMQSPVIKPGQKLIIPAATSVPQNRVPTRAENQQRATQQAVQTMRPAGEATAATPASAAVPPAAAPSGGAVVATPAAPPGGTYTIQSGESFYGVARKHKVKAEELAQVNGITDVTKIKQGQVLKIPGPGATPSPAVGSGAVAAAPATMPAVQPAAPAARPVSAASIGKIGATGTKVAALGTAPTSSAASDLVTTTDAGTAAHPSETAAAAKGRAEPAKVAVAPAAKPAVQSATSPATSPVGAVGMFRWPVNGKVITKFGPRDDGSHNDGINIAVPAGTDVQAAEGGTVAYAGNELKGYGNLILIRHDENWVSAYAHNDQLLVKRGDKIKRGQVVAKAGKSGTVDQPQVHFELRQGSKPVDPLKHLASN